MRTRMQKPAKNTKKRQNEAPMYALSTLFSKKTAPAYATAVFNYCSIFLTL